MLYFERGLARAGWVWGFGMNVVNGSRRLETLGGALTAVAVAAALVIAPPDQLKSVVLRPQVHSVQLQAISTSAVLNAAGSVEAPSSAGSPSVNAAAVASADGSPNLLGAIATAALGAVLLPLWYLSFPVTLPAMILFVAALGGVCSGCYSGQSYANTNPLAYIVLPAIQFWLTAPIQRVFGSFTSTPAAAIVAAPRAAVVGRSAVATSTRSLPASKAAGSDRSRKSVTVRSSNAAAAKSRSTVTGSRHH